MWFLGCSHSAAREFQGDSFYTIAVMAAVGVLGNSPRSSLHRKPLLHHFLRESFVLERKPWAFQISRDISFFDGCLTM